MSIEIIKVPDIGGAEGVEVIEICVAIGDQVAEEESLVVLESDKASMEVPSPLAGTVNVIKISAGDSLSEGDVILELETAAIAESSSEEGVVEGAVVDQQDKIVETEYESTPESTPEPTFEPTLESRNVAHQQTATSIEVINIPDIGGVDSVDVIEVCVGIGDEVAEGDSLVVLETDKASMEVPAPRAGKVVSVKIQEGDQVSEGVELLQMQVSVAAVDANAATPAVQANQVVETVVAPLTQNQQPDIPTPSFASAQPEAKVDPGAQTSAQSGIYAGPAVRRLAREMGADLSKVKGSGPKGRIGKDDLKAFIKTALTTIASPIQSVGITAIPEVDFAKFGDVRVEPLTKIHKLTAANMHRNWLNIPHVTQFDDADITELEEFRQSLKAEAEQRGVRITPLPFILKACAVALKVHPKFNASLHTDGEHRVYKQYAHIGMAVDTPAGLVVPVVRDVDKKSIWDMVAEIAELAQKAKDRKLKPAEMQGGCFTLSSLGSIGGQGFTPIVNAPEVAILGVSRLAVKPVWNGDKFVPRKMLPLSLSYDHRAINGGDAGRFFTYLLEVLADIRRIVL
ncbi:MAG: dihydrolipoyllysine-residue acetyltransferase [Pseudomonadales bacterium]